MSNETCAPIGWGGSEVGSCYITPFEFTLNGVPERGFSNGKGYWHGRRLRHLHHYDQLPEEYANHCSSGLSPINMDKFYAPIKGDLETFLCNHTLNTMEATNK